MMSKTNLKSYLSVVLVAFLLISLIGCAGKKPFWGDVKNGLILEYRMPQDKALKYQFSSKMTQDMEVMGQSMQSIIDMDLLFSAIFLSEKGK